MYRMHISYSPKEEQPKTKTSKNQIDSKSKTKEVKYY